MIVSLILDYLFKYFCYLFLIKRKNLSISTVNFRMQKQINLLRKSLKYSFIKLTCLFFFTNFKLIINKNFALKIFLPQITQIFTDDCVFTFVFICGNICVICV